MRVDEFRRSIYLDGHIIERQDDALGHYIYCPNCRRPLYKTDTPGFYAWCIKCEKDYYLIDALHEGIDCPVSVGRPPEGITLNSGLGIEYLIDKNGNKIIFPSVKDAAEYLKNNGVDEKWLNVFYYIDAAMQAEIDGESVPFNQKSDNNEKITNQEENTNE